MKTLMLCQRIPHPPDRGDRITTSHVLGLLRSLGPVRVGCFQEHPREDAGRVELERLGVEVFAVPIRPRLRRLLALLWLPTGRPLTLPFFYSRALARRVAEWLAEGIDLAFCYSSSMGQYLLGRQGLPRVMQFAELDSDKWAQLARRAPPPGSWIYRREARLLAPFEAAVAREFDLSLVVSPLEKELFQARIPGVEPMVVENGVDTEAFRPGPDPAREEAAIFTGVLSYEPNVMGVLRFAREAWPLVRTRRPGARLFVVGSDPVAAVRALSGKDGILVTGRVPRTQEWFDRARVAVAPLWIARGIQNKVLEAMSMALPVVATPAAFGGIDARPGEHLLVAEEPRAQAELVAGLLADPAAAARRGAAARLHVERRYRWAAILAGLEAALRALAAPLT